MFLRGEPTFSFLFKIGQINSSSFSPHSYLLHPRFHHQHNPRVALPTAVQSRFSFSYITEGNSPVIKNKRGKKQKKSNSRGSCPTNPHTPPYWYHPLYFPYFRHYIGGDTGKRSLHKLLIARFQIVSYSHLNTALFSFALLSPLKSYAKFIPINHTHKIIGINYMYQH